MRILSSWPQYLATAATRPASRSTSSRRRPSRAELADGPVRLGDRDRLSVAGRCAGHGRGVARGAVDARRSACRSGAGCGDARGREVTRPVPSAAPITSPTVTRAWRPGDTWLSSTSTCPRRATVPDPRIDAIRGSVALERGPLVYCLETADLPAGGDVDSLVSTRRHLSRAARRRRPRQMVLELADSTRGRTPAWPYRGAATASATDGAAPIADDALRRGGRPVLRLGEPLGGRNARLDPADGGAD